ncbi:MAG: hypothetical protein U1G07_16685 [Verrucomicrobiota bacterium]
MNSVIFTLTSARSGTHYLKALFQHNVRNCVCRHEPFFDWGNPTLFGRAIYDAHVGRLDRVKAQLAKKRQYISHLQGDVYVETSHAFLKSAYVAAMDFFPQLQLVHLIRDPLKVAKSEAWRQQWRQRVHAPFHFYRADDGGRYFVWALTGKEEIFRSVNLADLSLFQWCLIEWIEIENRAIQFLRQHRLEKRCVTLHTPGDLNDPGKVAAMFQILGLSLIHPTIQLRGHKSTSLKGSTVITPEDEAEAEAVIAQLPPRYLEIFQEEPYRNYAWSRRLRP